MKKRFIKTIFDPKQIKTQNPHTNFMFPNNSLNTPNS